MQQHTVILQTLYSSKSAGEKALHFEYALAQARADVFFSLLFGGRIIASAGAFLDSTIAIRVFGELFSRSNFFDVCEAYGWKPLTLNTERDEARTPEQYLIERWSDPKLKLTFFRESDPQYVAEGDRNLEIRRSACDCLAGHEYGRLAHILEPLFVDHQVKASDHVALQRHQELTDEALPPTHSLMPAQIPAVLNERIEHWTRCFMKYFQSPDTFNHRQQISNPDAILGFSAVNAISGRIAGLTDDTNVGLKRDELQKLNQEFLRRHTASFAMTPFHNEGPSHFGEYYPLLQHWVETEWHSVRQKAYAAGACVLSTDWAARQLFDFDSRSKIDYASDTTIDDGLRETQQEFADIDFDILLDVVRDGEWQNVIASLRTATEQRERKKSEDAILKLLARHMTQFSFDSENGRVAISSKGLASLGGFAGYAGIVAKYHGTIEGFLGSHLSWPAVALGAQLTKDLMHSLSPALRATVPGLQLAHRTYNNLRLRRAIVPSIYRPIDERAKAN